MTGQGTQPGDDPPREQDPGPESGTDETGVGAVLDQEDDGASERRRPRGLGCLVALAVLVLMIVLAYVGLTKGVEWAQDQFADADDYPGPGSGSVQVVVEPGDSTTDIGRSLEEENVVASLEAFQNAAAARPDAAASIQPGSYQFREEMKAADAFAVLADSENRIVDTVTVPEGLRVVDIVDILAEETSFSKKQFNRALQKTGQLGLPAYAQGNPEGYLFPATYQFGPKDRPLDMLKAMVERWRQAADEANLEQVAQQSRYSAAELMIVASLVEAEGRGDDMPKIARVIYNRLENPGTNGTTGRLEIDATVNYALGRNLGVALSAEDLKVDSPYNTRRYRGLPPGPIEAPGDAAIQAAINPAEGNWYYYVTVNLKTGETKFAETYPEFLKYKQEFTDYCTTSDAC